MKAAMKNLRDVADIVMGQSPKGETCNRDGTGLPLLNGPTEFGPMHPYPTQFTTDAKKKSNIGDLLFCVRGSTTGRMNWADQEYAIGRGIAAIRHRENPKLQPLIRAAIEVHLSDLLQSATGSTFPNVSGPQLGSVPFPAISKSDAESIAATLGALDDKIDLNRRMNETLEAMARALFKDWFVDFGPTRAKMEGREPYLAQEIWDLFPDKLDDEGKPEGWETKSLGDFDLELESGRRPKGGIDKGLTNGIPSVGAESIYGVGRFDYSKVKFVSDEFGRASRSGWVQAHDVAIYKDGANVGDPSRVALFGCGFPFDKFMVNEHVFLLRSKDLGQGFLYFLMQSHKIADRLEKLGTAKAAQPGLNQGEVKSCSFVFPGPVMCENFNTIVSPWIVRGLRNGKENQTLGQTRDLLLPKLMSGEIRVADAEQASQEAT